ncbi:MAG: carbohydrate kinase family protein [Candidatus Caldatribacteriota bacterium]
MDIVVCGHICLDIIPSWFSGGIENLVPGHIIEMSGVDISTGGSVANTGLVLYRLGIKPILLGKIGNDLLGKIILEILQREDPELGKYMIISDQDFSSYTIVLNPPDTDRIFLHYPGSNNTFNARDIPYDLIKDACLFHFGYPPLMNRFYQNDGEELVQMFSKVRSLGMITSLDMAMPDPKAPSGRIDWKRLLQKVLPYVDIFGPSIDELLYMWNKKEYQLWISGKKVLTLEEISQLSQDLINCGTSLVMIKLGNAGLFLQTGKMSDGLDLSSLGIKKQEWSQRQLYSTCFKTSVVGTTGAGDATIAGFLSQIIRGSSPEETMNIATATGAYCVEARDATSGIRSIKEVKKRIRRKWKKQSPSFSTRGWQWLSDYQLWERKPL